MAPLTGILAAAFALAACSGKPAAEAAAVRKLDQSPIQGANAGYNDPGWKVGDATSWETHMKARSQGQNEYSRTGAASR